MKQLLKDLEESKRLIDNIGEYDISDNIQKIINRIKRYQNNLGPSLFLKDTGTDNSIHKYGTNPHDSLILQNDGSIHYYNLQNGCGTQCPEEGYTFCLEDGTDPRTLYKDYGDSYLDIGGHGGPK